MLTLVWTAPAAHELPGFSCPRLQPHHRGFGTTDPQSRFYVGSGGFMPSSSHLYKHYLLSHLPRPNPSILIIRRGQQPAPLSVKPCHSCRVLSSATLALLHPPSFPPLHHVPTCLSGFGSCGVSHRRPMCPNIFTYVHFNELLVGFKASGTHTVDTGCSPDISAVLLLPRVWRCRSYGGTGPAPSRASEAHRWGRWCGWANPRPWIRAWMVAADLVSRLPQSGQGQ